MAILAFSSNNIFDSTSAGRALLTAADASAQRTLLGLSSSGVVSSQSLALSGQSLTGSTETSVFDATATWNTTGTPTAINLNVTDTASNASSLLMDLRVGGVSMFKVAKSGQTNINNSLSTGGFDIFCGALMATSFIGVDSSGDTKFFRDAAGIFAQRNGVNSQVLRVYNTYTDASNYERLALKWNSNAFQIQPEAAGTGVVRPLQFPANGIGSTPPVALTGTWFTGGTPTTTKPQLLIEPTGTTSTSWSTAGTGLGVNAPSGFTGDLAWFGVNGSRALSVSRSGTGAMIRNTNQSNDSFLTIEQTRLNEYGRAWINILGGYGAPGDGITFGVANTQLMRIWANFGTSRITITSTVGLNWNEDLWLWRDAASALAQRNGGNAQTFRLYNTFTNSTNFERLNIRWTSNEAIIDTQAGSGGGTLRGLRLGSAATSLLGFYNATPVVQPAAVADATDAASVITQLNLLLARIRTLGLIAT